METLEIIIVPCKGAVKSSYSDSLFVFRVGAEQMGDGQQLLGL